MVEEAWRGGVGGGDGGVGMEGRKEGWRGGRRGGVGGGDGGAGMEGRGDGGEGGWWRRGREEWRIVIGV